MSASNTSSKPDGAAGAFYYISGHNIYVLVGKESKFVSDYIRLPVGANNEPRIIIHPDTHEPFTIVTCKAYETVTAADLEDAHRQFTKRARALTHINHITIRYDLPQMIGAHNGVKVYRAHYRMLYDIPDTYEDGKLKKGKPIQYGVVKGNYETTDRNLHATLQRELMEEAGVEIAIDMIRTAPTSDVYNTVVYYIPLSAANIMAFREAIHVKNQSSYGELYALQFMKLETLKNEKRNAITKHVVKHLPTIA